MGHLIVFENFFLFAKKKSEKVCAAKTHHFAGQSPK